MRIIAATLLLLVCFAAAARAEPRHPCAADAIKRAIPLLTLHYSDGTNQKPDHPLSVDDRVRVLPPIKALKGDRRFDVLEVIGSIYRADYRMRFIYARLKDGDCLLMGQEILEIAAP